MSYLTLQSGVPDFSKAVFSLWFRAPKASVVAASKNKVSTGLENFDMLQGILPLVTFGKQQKQQIYNAVKHNVATINTYQPGEPDPTTTYMTDVYVKGPSFDVEPSFIGLSCRESGQFNVVFNIQMKGFMALKATQFMTTEMSIYSGADPSAPIGGLGSGVVSLFPNVGVATIQDISYINNNQPEFFNVTSSEYFAPDQWHHLLLSFDVGGLVAIGTPFASSSCRLWYAIDDIDYRGAINMQPYRNLGGQWGPDTLGPNTILTQNAWRFSGSDPNWEAIHYYQNRYVGLPQGTYGPDVIPSGNAEMGLPASVRYVDGIFRVEMAEFQMWTGVTLDTGILSNRRAFVDKDGEPVDPTVGSEDDPRGPGEKLLGKKPEILLHGSDEWQSGHNTGTIGVIVDGEGNETDILSGQFRPTAKIEPYQPDPSLEKTTA